MSPGPPSLFDDGREALHRPIIGPFRLAYVIVCLAIPVDRDVDRIDADLDKLSSMPGELGAIGHRLHQQTL